MIITFTCPHCNGHQLQQIRQAMHRTEVKLTTTQSGQLQATPIGVVEDLRGPILGYRCKKCRYPDTVNHEDSGGFFWPTPEAVHEAGCLTISDTYAKPHRCMICHKDGRTEPLLVESAASTLTATERTQILSRRGLKGAVLLCESDPGIVAFACTDWQGVDTENI